MAKFCQNCGAPLGENVKFCTSCGSALAPQPPQQPQAQQAAQPQAQQPAQPQAQQPTQPQAQQPAQPQYQQPTQPQAQQPTQPQYQQPAQPQYQQPTQPQYQQPAQPQYQQPQYAPQAQSAPAKKKGKGGRVVAVILCLAAIGAVCFFGFRDGGFFRPKEGVIDGGKEKEPTIVYDVKTVESLLDYAKKLEEAGNVDAAAAVYELIAKGGGADYIDEAHRDFPLVSAADEVEEFKGLFEKKGGVGK